MTLYDLFLSYKFTGVPEKELEATVLPLQDAFRKNGFSLYCSYEDEHKFQHSSYDQILEYCLNIQKQTKAIFFYLAHPEPSTGMAKELEEARLANQKIVVAIQKNLSFPQFTEVADRVITYDTFDGLLDIVKTIHPENL